jgi:hypothetical protein
MNGHKLKGLNAPTEDDEAATKGYIRDSVIYGKGKNLLKVVGIGRWSDKINDSSYVYQADGLTGRLTDDGTIEISGTVTSAENSY